MAFFVQQVVSLQAELSYLQGHLATLEVPHPPQHTPPQATIAPPVISIADLTSAPATASASTMPAATYDLSLLFDPMTQSPWSMQQRAIDPRHYLGSGAPSSSSGGGDLQALARELSHRHGSNSHAAPPVACSNASSSHSLSK